VNGLLSWFCKGRSSRRPSGRRAQRSGHFPPTLEVLEDRVALSSLTAMGNLFAGPQIQQQMTATPSMVSVFGHGGIRLNHNETLLRDRRSTRQRKGRR
jgi:hypothetical protein